MKCPQCGRKMKGDWPDKELYFNCEFCGDRFVIEDDGELVNVFNRGSNNHGTCINCGQSLTREPIQRRGRMVIILKDLLPVPIAAVITTSKE